jgi:hypothetical protein
MPPPDELKLGYDGEPAPMSRLRPKHTEHPERRSKIKDTNVIQNATDPNQHSSSEKLKSEASPELAIVVPGLGRCPICCFTNA